MLDYKEIPLGEACIYTCHGVGALEPSRPAHTSMTLPFCMMTRRHWRIRRVICLSHATSIRYLKGRQAGDEHNMRYCFSARTKLFHSCCATANKSFIERPARHLLACVSSSHISGKRRRNA